MTNKHFLRIVKHGFKYWPSWTLNLLSRVTLWVTPLLFPSKKL